jgi:hypothetical protein
LKVLFLLAALIVGGAVGAFLLFLIGLLLGAWRRHWDARIEHVSGPRLGFSVLSLHSKHHHRVLNLRCVVRDPSGREWPKAVWLPGHTTHHVMRPGEHVNVTYPLDFDAPLPNEPGTNVDPNDMAPWPVVYDHGSFERPDLPRRYTIEWVTDVAKGQKPKVLARRTWKEGSA